MKLKQLAFPLFLLLAACNQPDSSKTESENEKIVKQYFEYFNKHDWKKMAAMYSDTAEFKDPSLGTNPVKQTKAQIEKKYADLNAMFKDVHDEVINIYPSGTKNIAVEFISTGTAPDSTQFKLPICTIFTIENLLITKDYTYYDNF